jgi:SAM-dependent methyltransferase
MGSSIKTLNRLMGLTERGALRPGSRICDIGATQIFGAHALDGARAFLDFYASRRSGARKADEVDRSTLEKISQGGFLGELLVLAGFDYLSLDIFEGYQTILFDLNVHAPGPRLASSFDLVMNLGTTEHVFHQYRAFQTLHELLKPGGALYCDLPMGGYLRHGFFHYDPLFFESLAKANSYEILFEAISVGNFHPVPEAIKKMGYTRDNCEDLGFEAVFRKSSAQAFQIHLETSTSLALDPRLAKFQAEGLVEIPATTTVHYGSTLDRGTHSKSEAEGPPFWVRWFRR